MKIPYQLRPKDGKGLAWGARHRQREVIKLFGTIEFEPGFNHKAERSKH